MEYYIYLVIAVVLFAIQLSFSKLYQLKAGISFGSILYFSFFCALASAISFLALSGFVLDPIPPYSLLMGALIGLVFFSLNLLGIKTMSLGNMSLYSMFLMLGLMLLPFLYGRFFLDESVSVAQTIAFFLLIVALVIPALQRTKQKNSLLFYFLCVLLFLANGLGGILAKTHQINIAAINAIDFTVVIQSATMVYTIIALVIYWLVKKRQTKTVEASSGLTLSRLFHDKLIVYVVGFSLFSSTGYLLQLMSAVHLPATVMYPIVTGGSVVLTSIAGKVFFREKMSKLALISISLAFVATILFAL